MANSNTDAQKPPVEEAEELAATSFKIPADLWKRTRILSVQTGKTATQIVIDALWKHVTLLEVKLRK